MISGRVWHSPWNLFDFSASSHLSNETFEKEALDKGGLADIGGYNFFEAITVE